MTSLKHLWFLEISWTIHGPSYVLVRHDLPSPALRRAYKTERPPVRGGHSIYAIAPYAGASGIFLEMLGQAVWQVLHGAVAHA